MPERMRVLQLSKFFPPVMGGIETVAWELAEGLVRAGAQCDVLCSADSWRSSHEHWPAGYRVLRCASLGRVMSTSMAPRLPLQLHQTLSGADVLHVHMPDPMAAAAVWLTRPRVPVVLHWHSDVIRQRRALRLYEPLQRWLLARAASVVATSPPYAESSAALRPFLDKVCVVPIGITDHRPAARSERALALRRRYGGRPLVFALGRMTYYKGFDVLIRAVQHMHEDCAVLIGGDGELLTPLRSLVSELGLGARVFLPGHVPDDELACHFEACDVFCMPSTVRAEAYGVAMLEAMAMARPVVAMNIHGSGVPWVNRHGQTGLNVPPGEPHPLAQALDRLVADPALRLQLGAEARRRYETEFSADRMTQRLIEVYQAIGVRGA